MGGRRQATRPNSVLSCTWQWQCNARLARSPRTYETRYSCASLLDASIQGFSRRVAEYRNSYDKSQILTVQTWNYGSKSSVKPWHIATSLPKRRNTLFWRARERAVCDLLQQFCFPSQGHLVVSQPNLLRFRRSCSIALSFVFGPPRWEQSLSRSWTILT